MLDWPLPCADHAWPDHVRHVDALCDHAQLYHVAAPCASRHCPLQIMYSRIMRLIKETTVEHEQTLMPLPEYQFISVLSGEGAWGPHPRVPCSVRLRGQQKLSHWCAQAGGGGLRSKGTSRFAQSSRPLHSCLRAACCLLPLFVGHLPRQQPRLRYALGQGLRVAEGCLCPQRAIYTWLQRKGPRSLP